MEQIAKSGLTAILTKDGPVSYRELHEKSSALAPIFYAHPTLDSIFHIFSRMKRNLPLFPVSTRELTLPEIALPSSGILIATSGSSGSPKQAHLSLENLYYNALFPHPDLILKPGDHYLLSVPLYHISGLSILVRSFLSEATIVMPDAGKESEVTHISFVPTQLKRFLQNPSPYPKLKAILVGGAPIPYSLCKEAHDKGFPLYLTYGMTEMASQITTQKFDPKSGISFGDPLPHRELKIASDGEIWVRSKTLFQGYHNHPSPFINGWFPTKDLGKIGPNGLELYGRKDRVINSGGEKIHPEEIEKVLLSHPQISRVKVLSRPDLEFGQRPTALIEATISTEAILDHLSSLLPRYKIPKENDITLCAKDHLWVK